MIHTLVFLLYMLSGLLLGLSLFNQGRMSAGKWYFFDGTPMPEIWKRKRNIYLVAFLVVFLLALLISYFNNICFNCWGKPIPCNF